ncbi:MAG TPA: hypothetical protein VFF65_12355 [Phycisphaerales bacterium]|nr:hypothetical protein [Phycisphaerales bacterium]
MPPSGGRTRRAAILAAATLTALAGTARAQSPVYRNGFSEPSNPGWSASRTFTARSGGTLLGRFHNEPVSLTVDGLPRHGNVVVAFDLYLLGKWSGEARPGEPATTLTVTLDDGTLIHCSLANDDGDSARRQSFPDEPGGATRPAALGAYRVNALGVSDELGRPVLDSHYRMVFTAPHGASVMKLTLAAAGLPGTVKDASWAIDNAVVYAVAEDADLEVARSAAREAVTRSALGLAAAATGVGFGGAPAPRLLSAPHDRAWSDGPVGSPAMLEGALSPADLRGPDSILAEAMDRESRAAAFSGGAQPPAEFTFDLALAPAAAGPSPYFVAPAPSARIEQPVTRRVSSLVYQSRFTEAPGAQWDVRRLGVAPRGERFAGPFGNETATLRVGDITGHDQLIIDVDLYTIGDWQGDGPDPSRFALTVDGQRILAETFANEDGDGHRTQSYPGALKGGAKARLPGADASSLDALGFAPPGQKAVGDASYRLRFVVPHSAAEAALRFTASGLPEGKASWGVDNITIVASGDRSMSYGDATGMEPDDNAEDGDYMNPFVRAAGKEWNVEGMIDTTPSGEMFLGRMHNQTAELTVSNFPVHTHLVIAADVVVIGDWQGNGPDPSRFGIKLSDGTVVLATTFATDGGAPDATQEYPDAGEGRNLPGAGAASVGAMGYKDAAGVSRDAVYRLIFTLPHTASNETISFTATGLRGDDAKASWGLDNVCVTTIDSANPIGGGGTALGDAGGLAFGNPSGGTIGGYAQGDPLGSNPFIPPVTPGDFPDTPDGPTEPPVNPPVAPAPGALPALLIGIAAAMRRNRRA